MGSKWLDNGEVRFCVFMNRDEVEVHKNAKKKEASLVNKGFIILPKDDIKQFRFCGNEAGDPEGHDGPILHARVADHNTGFASSCPLADPAI